MTAYSSEGTAGGDGTLSRFVVALRASGWELVRYRVFGLRIVLEGRVPSYEAKCKIESMARSAGFVVVNCLRVSPGSTNGDCIDVDLDPDPVRPAA